MRCQGSKLPRERYVKRKIFQTKVVAREGGAKKRDAKAKPCQKKVVSGENGDVKMCQES